MNVFLFLKGELRQSKGVFFGLTVLLALALAVAVSVIQTERMVKSSTIRAADQFDILVGTKGSRSALLLGTVYLRDEMLSLVPMPVLNNLSPKSSDISWAAPLAFGDRAGKASLVGTTRVFVDQAGKRTLLAGRNFEKPYEAVAGSNAGFSINDEFHPGHGMSAALGHEHKESFRIVAFSRKPEPPGIGQCWFQSKLYGLCTVKIRLRLMMFTAITYTKKLKPGSTRICRNCPGHLRLSLSPLTWQALIASDSIC